MQVNRVLGNIRLKQFAQSYPNFDPLPIAQKIKSWTVSEAKEHLLKYTPSTRSRIIQALPDTMQNELKVLGVE